MRILAISDIHGWLPVLDGPDADVLVIAGDLVNEEYLNVNKPNVL